MFASRNANTFIKNLGFRSYALSRFPKRSAGAGRSRAQIPTIRKTKVEEEPEIKHEFDPPRHPERLVNRHDLESGLGRLLLQRNTLVIERKCYRQLEMMNVFIGFEEANKYTITSEDGESLGFIAEEPKGFLGVLSRQMFATHRPFRAVIMDHEGIPVLWVRRPFAWINSRMHVQRLKDQSEYIHDAEASLETFGEVQQIWHPWRRRYDLFLRENLLGQDLLADPETVHNQSEEAAYYQIAKVDSPFLSWRFRVVDEHENEMARIERAFRGLGREIFTDTGKYSVHFEPSRLEEAVPELSNNLAPDRSQIISKELNLDARALLLALAVNIDFDYFSRHSHAGPGAGLFHFD